MTGADLDGTSSDESYTYDNEGNRTLRYKDVDDSGTLNSGDTDITEYEWDHRNRLTKVTERATQGGSVTQVVDHTYDAANRWINRTVDTDGDGTPDEKTVFVHDGGQIVMELEDSVASASEELTKDDLAHRYLWGPAVDMLLADEQVDDLFNAANNETLWALTDHLNSVRDLVDNSGNVRMHREYDSFGEISASTHYDASGLVVIEGDPGYLTIDIGYTGKYLEESTALANHNERWYEATTGSWTRLDIIWGDGPNRYAYVGNQPTTLVDPSGLKGLRPITLEGIRQLNDLVPQMPGEDFDEYLAMYGFYFVPTQTQSEMITEVKGVFGELLSKVVFLND